MTMLAHAKGYKSHILLPSDVAMEKVELLEKLGATVERVKPASIVDKEQFVNLARRRAEERGRGLFADQFENEVNWKCHASFPVLACNAITLSVYRLSPVRSVPEKAGAGFPTPQ